MPLEIFLSCDFMKSILTNTKHSWWFYIRNHFEKYHILSFLMFVKFPGVAVAVAMTDVIFPFLS